MTYTETLPPAIRVAGLTKRWGERTVLDGLDLSVTPGSVYALLGPNGAGKSTFIRILTTLAPADDGVVEVAGHDVAAAPAEVRRAISVTGQATAVDELLTGRENVRMVARIAGLGRRDAAARADELLAEFDLLDAADQRAGSYSGGMRRRLDLAASLVVVPAVLFLDEPTTGLDTRSRQTLWRRIEELAAAGTTILLTTQYLEEADELADRIGVLDGGRLVAEGTAAELKARVGHRGARADDRRRRRPLVRGRPARRDARRAGLDPRAHRRLGQPPPRRARAARHPLHHRRPRRRPRTELGRRVPGADRGGAMSVAVEAEFVRRGIRHTARNPDALITSLALPIILLLLFVYVFGGAINTGGEYVDYVVPGIIVLCAMFGSAGTAVGVCTDKVTGVMDRFRTMPIRGAAVLVGHVVASLLRNLVATALVIGLAIAIGFRPDATPVEWSAAIAVIALVVLAVTWLAAAAGLLAGSVESANALGFAVMFLPYLSSAFVPVDTLPSYLQGVARHQPVTPVIETLRGLLIGTPIGHQAWWVIAWWGGLLAVSIVASSALFRRRAGS